MDPIRSTYEADPEMLEIVCEFARELPARAAMLEALLASRSTTELGPISTSSMSPGVASSRKTSQIGDPVSMCWLSG